MTVVSSSLKETYQGNGSAITFAYTFKVFAKNDGIATLKVTHKDASGVETVLIQDTHYTISGIRNGAGGTITYPISGPALASGETLTLTPSLEIEQETDLINQGGGYKQTIEEMVDYVTTICKQLQEQLNRTLKTKITSEGEGGNLPDPEDGRVLTWSGADGTVVNGPTTGDIFSAKAAAAASEANAASSADAAASSQASAAASEANAASSADAAASSQTNAAASETHAAASALNAEVAKIEWKSAWSEASAYEVSDAVESNGSSYVCIQAHTDQQPPDLAYWNLLAEKGRDGIGAGDLLAENNLSDLADAAAARENLGLGDAATRNVGVTADAIAAGAHVHGAAGINDGAVTLDKLAYGGANKLLGYDSLGAPAEISMPSRSGLESIQVFRSSGQWERPGGVSKIVVWVVGGGGGGGDDAWGEAVLWGGGGGGGGGAVKVIDVSSISSVRVRRGERGGGSRGGGTSSFGSYCSATGGRSGTSGGDNRERDGIGGEGGRGSGGDFNSEGTRGGSSSRESGGGGGSFLGKSGGDGLGRYISSEGGEHGIVIVWEYA